MSAETSLRVKICGITNPADARLAAESGADLVGAVLVPSSPRAVTAAAARDIGSAAGLSLALVLADLKPSEVVRNAREAGAAVLQLHGGESAGMLRTLRDEGEWEVWKAVRVRGKDDILAAVDRYHEGVDLLLLDAWQRDRLGGTGHRFGWDVLEDVRGELPDDLAIGVAGGLTAENVGEAVRRLMPSLVDVSSGVEREPGRKDHGAVRAFVSRARRAAATGPAERDVLPSGSTSGEANRERRAEGERRSNRNR